MRCCEQRQPVLLLQTLQGSVDLVRIQDTGALYRSILAWLPGTQAARRDSSTLESIALTDRSHSSLALVEVVECLYADNLGVKAPLEMVVVLL